MTTKKEYKKNLENGIITEEMLELVLYSIDKRAKNCRDKKNEYYEQKDFLLTTLLKPICIHKTVSIKEFMKRICSSEDEYWQYKNSPNVIYTNCYYRYYDKERDKVINFVDVITRENIEEYFLYYKTKNYAFHIPIDNPHKYSNLEIIEIDNLETYGKDIKELASVQFCKKVIELVKSGNYQYIPNK